MQDRLLSGQIKARQRKGNPRRGTLWRVSAVAGGLSWGQDKVGFSALMPIPKGRQGGAEERRPLRSWPLRRRSGRFPPLPYPPLRSWLL